MSSKVVLATGNAGKVREMQGILEGKGFIICPQSDYSVPEADETGLTFVENAIIKARNACKHTGLPSIADDSGIEVDYLNAEPGIYSSRFAGKNASNAENNEKLLQQMQGVEDSQRTARFQCVIVYLKHEKDPTPLICQGSWEGYITEKIAGTGGFGYDPLFYVPDYHCTAAELPAETKRKISHRGQALAKLLVAIPNQQNLKRA